METLILYLLIVVAVALVALILMQQTDASAGELFGGSDGDGIHRTRRGSELTIFKLTIYLAVAFAGLALLSFLL
jgi:protein translocase SecG subunit